MGTDKLDVGNKASFFIQAQLCIYLMRLQFEALPNPLKAEECPSTLAYRWPKCSEWIKRVELSIYIKKKEKRTLTPQQNPNVLMIWQAFCVLPSLHAVQLYFSYFPVGGLFPWLPVLASNSWHLGTQELIG